MVLEIWIGVHSIKGIRFGIGDYRAKKKSLDGWDTKDGKLNGSDSVSSRYVLIF